MLRARLALALLALVPAVSRAAPSDGTIVTYSDRDWSTLTDDPAHLSLDQNDYEVAVASRVGGSPNDDALDLSTFALSTASDFSLQLSFLIQRQSITTFGGANDAVGLVFGVGRDLAGTDSAAIGVGFAAGGLATASTIAYRTDDVQTTGASEVLTRFTGMLQIDYSAALDRLTFSRVGSTFAYSLPDGTVRGTWGADQLLVSVGGRGSGITMISGGLGAFNFTVASGTVVPEPAALGAVGVGAVLLRRRRRTV